MANGEQRGTGSVLDPAVEGPVLNEIKAFLNALHGKSALFSAIERHVRFIVRSKRLPLRRQEIRDLLDRFIHDGLLRRSSSDPPVYVMRGDVAEPATPGGNGKDASRDEEDAPRGFVLVHGKQHFVDEHGFLRLKNLGIEDPSEIQGIDKLAPNPDAIDLSGNKLSSIPDISGMKRVRILIIDDNKIKDIRGLKLPPNLYSLYAKNNVLESTAGIDAYPYLCHATLSNNALRALDGFEALHDLETLEVDHNAIESLAPLAGCPKLREVQASHNKLRNLHGLEHLAELHVVRVDHNELESLDGLCWDGLDVIDASHNRIATLKVMRGVFDLDMSYNQIARIEFPDPKRVYIFEHFDVSHNKLETLDWARQVDPFGQCHEFSNAKGNPITNVDALDGLPFKQVPYFDRDHLDPATLKKLATYMEQYKEYLED